MTPKVLLLIETSSAFARGILAGVVDYIQSDGPWEAYLAEHGRGESVPAWVMNSKVDGILARVENEQIASTLRSLKVPVVDLSSPRLIPEIPIVTTNNEEIGRFAYQHFTERGFHNFAYCGLERYSWSRMRSDCFERSVIKGGGKCHHYRELSVLESLGSAEIDSIASWLKSLPKPVGVFTAYDERGQQVLAAARRAGLRVPEEVAVLGVDNDELMCELAPPPLSSVIPDTKRAGRLGAELLARMMQGEKVEPGPRLISPLGVATRQSTDIVAVSDPRIAGALRFIRDHATEGITVDQVLAKFPMARRSFELRMKALIGRTPHEEIRRVQLNRARELLIGTKLPLGEIADRCGFLTPEYLTVTFKREIGLSPRDFRNQHSHQDKVASPPGTPP